MGRRKQSRRSGYRSNKKSSQKDSTRGRSANSGSSSIPLKAERRKRVAGILQLTESDRTGIDWYDLGRFQVYDGFLDDSEELRNLGIEALQRACDFPEVEGLACIELVPALSGSGVPAMAQRFAQRATELLPDSAVSWRFLANTQMQRKQLDQAISCLQKAVTLPDTTAYDSDTLTALQSDDAPEGGPRPIQLPPPPPWTETASVEVQQEHARYQLFFMRQMLKLDPDDVRLLQLISQLHYSLGDYSATRRTIGQVHALDPANAEGHLLLGLIAGKERNSRAAITHYEKVLQSEPDHELALCNLAASYMSVGCVLYARIPLRHLLQLNPEHGNAAHLWANTIPHAEKDHEEELRWHHRAINLGYQTPASILSMITGTSQAGLRYDLLREWKTWKPYIEEAIANGELPDGCSEGIELILAVLNDDNMTSDEIVRFLLQADDSPLAEYLTPRFVQTLLNRAWKNRRRFKGTAKHKYSDLLCQIGIVAEDHQCFELAVTAFLESIAIEPTDLAAGGSLLPLLLDLDRVVEAREVFHAIKLSATQMAAFEMMLLASEQRFSEVDQLLAAWLANDKVKETDVEIIASIVVLYGRKAQFDRLAAHAESTGIPQKQQQLWTLKWLANNGFPSEAAELLREKLAKADNAQGEIRPQKAMAATDAITSEESEETLMLELGRCLLASAQATAFESIFTSLSNQHKLSPDWFVLMSMRHLASGEHAEANGDIAWLPDFPHVLASRALISSHFEAPELTHLIVDELLKRPLRPGYVHPWGNTHALGFVARSYALNQEELSEQAMAAVNQALHLDNRCHLAWRQKLNLYVAAGDLRMASEIAEAGLRWVPGDPQLVTWKTEYLLNLGDHDAADTLLSRERRSLNSRGNSELAAHLGERIARARLSQQPQVTETEASLPWAENLSSESRDWLESACLAEKQSEKLALAVTLYYCKIVEREYAMRLVGQFMQSMPQNTIRTGERDLRDFVRCAEQGHLPALGSIARALTKAAMRADSRESELMTEWRRFLKRLPEPLCTQLRRRNVLDALHRCANIRNQIAHINSATADDYEFVQQAVLIKTTPGPLLQAIGIDGVENDKT